VPVIAPALMKAWGVGKPGPVDEPLVGEVGFPVAPVTTGPS
jgi:hypothetical protein